MNEQKLKRILEKYKFPLIILCFGIMLMLMPGGKSTEVQNQTVDSELSLVLSSTQGVGKAQVIVSDNGVVVVCEGADKAKVKFEIIQAITSYTGYSSDRITVLKMAK